MASETGRSRRSSTRQGGPTYSSPLPRTPARVAARHFFQEELGTTAEEVGEEDEQVEEDTEEEEEEGDAPTAPSQSLGERMQGRRVSEVWVVSQPQSQGEREGYGENPILTPVTPGITPVIDDDDGEGDSEEEDEAGDEVNDSVGEDEQQQGSPTLHTERIGGGVRRSSRTGRTPLHLRGTIYTTYHPHSLPSRLQHSGARFRS